MAELIHHDDDTIAANKSITANNAIESADNFHSPETGILACMKTSAQELFKRLGEGISVQELKKIGDMFCSVKRKLYIPTSLLFLLAGTMHGQVSSHKIDVSGFTVYADRIKDADHKPNGFSAGYTYDIQPDNSRIGFQIGGEYASMAHEETVKSRYETSMYQVKVGSYITIPSGDSYGDYYERGGSGTIGINLGVGSKNTTAETPSSRGQFTETGTVITGEIYAKYRQRNADKSFEIGPFLTYHFKDNIDGRQRGNNLDYSIGLRASYGFSLRD